MENLESLGMYVASNPTLIIILSIYQGLWSMLGVWFAARKNHRIWFVVIAISNTLGIIEAIYLFRNTNFFKDFDLNG
tara:strand:+ start:688 stop:918 length:231 start_codon:yes stop_codon:yes gene_type:complete